jgi:hypothetical protein
MIIRQDRLAMEKEQRNYKTAGTAFQIGSVPHGSAKARADPEFLFGAAGARIVGWPDPAFRRTAAAW